MTANFTRKFDLCLIFKDNLSNHDIPLRHHVAHIKRLCNAAPLQLAIAWSATNLIGLRKILHFFVSLCERFTFLEFVWFRTQIVNAYHKYTVQEQYVSTLRTVNDENKN